MVKAVSTSKTSLSFYETAWRSILYKSFVGNQVHDTCSDHWIGRGGPFASSPRSPDLHPLQFYLWGHEVFGLWKEDEQPRPTAS
jgi:hypothetical protein